MIRAFLLALALLAGCGGPGRVEFVSGQCLIDGQAASLKEVEARQAAVSRRILDRAPLSVILTVLVVVLAGASHMEKLLWLFSARRRGGKKFSERLQSALERYRARPVRYFMIVVGTLALLLAAGGCYIYLDADKRASERALGMLEFCHLELRAANAQGVLSVERKNLDAIQSTAGDIRKLVDKLPPEEQHKAHQIVAQMNAALQQQSELLSNSLTQTQTSLKEQNEAMQRGLSSVEAGVLGLKSLPAGLHDLSSAVQKLDGHVGAFDQKLADTQKGLTDADARLAALDGELKALAARPAPACPACVCAPAQKPSEHDASHDAPHDHEPAPPPKVAAAMTHADAGAAANRVAPEKEAAHN